MHLAKHWWAGLFSSLDFNIIMLCANEASIFSLLNKLRSHSIDVSICLSVFS